MTEADVVVVGGGVVGTMHAREACRRGLRVTHLEADQAPRSASVRNLGLVWVSVRAPGPELTLALRSRELWEEIGSEVPGAGFRTWGSLTVAADEHELALMADVASLPDAVDRGLELLDRAGVRAAYPELRGPIVGGLRCTRDAIVEPREVLPSVRARLSAKPGYRWCPGRRVVGVAEGEVTDHLGQRHRGSLVVLCPGAALSGIGQDVGQVLAAAPMRRCRLQMLQTEPAPRALSTAVADGDSMRYYPLYDRPARGRLPEASRETREWGMQLLMVQRAGGELTIGDTHEYDEPFDFALEESVHDRLRARAEAILGWPLPPTARRWSGVYSVPTDDAVYFRANPVPGVVVVTGTGGRGMTLAPAIAEETFA